MKNYLEIVNGLVNFVHINMANRKIVWYKEYFTDFLSTLDDGTKRKVLQTLRLIQSIDVIPSQYFKHIENAKGLYEIRVEYSGNIYRICLFLNIVESDLTIKLIFNTSQNFRTGKVEFIN